MIPVFIEIDVYVTNLTRCTCRHAGLSHYPAPSLLFFPGLITTAGCCLPRSGTTAAYCFEICSFCNQCLLHTLLIRAAWRMLCIFLASGISSSFCVHLRVSVRACACVQLCRTIWLSAVGSDHIP